MKELVQRVIRLLLAILPIAADCLQPPNATKIAISFDFNATAVAVLLRQMDYVHLRLRNVADATSNNLVEYLLRQTECPLMLSISAWQQGANIFKPYERHRALLIHSSDLDSTLHSYASRSGILLCLLLDDPVEDELLQSARHMWQSVGVYKVYYMAPKRSVFFDPFALAQGHFGALVDLSQAPHFESAARSFNGYPLRVHIFNSVYSTVYGDATTKSVRVAMGADGKVAALLSRKLNFTMKLQWPDEKYFGTRLENGSYDGALGRMVRYETDVTLTGFFVKDYLTRDIEFSVSVYMDKLCCYVRKAKRIPQSILPLFVVDMDVWSSFLAVGALSPFLWMAIRYLNLSLMLPYARTKMLSGSFLRQYLRIFTDTWVVWVRVNIVRFPPFSSERVFVISICLVSVIFGALFESSLATVYIRPLYYHDINTMQELDEANYKIYIKHGAMRDDLFYGHSSPVYMNLNRKLVLVAELEERLISMMSKRGGFAAVTRASSLLLDDIYYFITRRIHKIPECPKSYHIAFVFPKKSPFQKAIDVALLHFIEAGLIAQWIEETKHKSKISIHRHPGYVAELNDKWKVLGLIDLQLAFYALAMGCLLAALAFAGELLTRWSLHLKFKSNEDLA